MVPLPAIGSKNIPTILRRREQSESAPKLRFRDTIGARLVVGIFFGVFMFGSYLIPWRTGFFYPLREKLMYSAAAGVVGFIFGARIAAA